MSRERLFELRRRTFDTPNFRGIEFIEVEAKSILNHVPGNYLPFKWTINPYRGCSHACVYCLLGETPVLMADGRTTPIKELRVGDRIYGTEIRGRYRRYVPTVVHDHWTTTKPAFRVTLEDGTSLVTSGDHRFLSNRGWKYVTPAQRPLQRPFLTPNNKLLGIGEFALGPKRSPEYRRGYLCGLIRGDGHLGSYSYARVGRTIRDVYRFRLAMTDAEALDRCSDYLLQSGVPTRSFDFLLPTPNHKGLRAIRTSSKGHIERIKELIEWPRTPSDEWRKGFLAGIFDAEGGCLRGILRISNTDTRVIDEIVRCLRRFGFNLAIEVIAREKPITYIRLIGGLRDRLRFFHTVDPAITRKRTIDGIALKSDAPLRVVSVEPLGFDVPMYDITTGTGDFIANGVVSHNCFARSTHTYMDMNAGRDFETKIVVKVNASQLLRRELRAKRWTGEGVAMGTATDPYQRAEGRYKLMPGIIGALAEVGNPFSILTKGTLILRDLDLLTRAAETADVSTAFSVATLDEAVWRKSEPGTPHPRKRLDAVRKLNDVGIPCGVMVAPVLPGISDSDGHLRAIVEAALDAKATFVSPILLHLRPKVKEVYMAWLEDAYPDLVPRYQKMYARSAYARKEERDLLGTRVDGLVGKKPLRRVRPRARPEPPKPEQLSFGLEG